MFDIEYKGGNTVEISTKKSTLVKEAVELATEARFAVNGRAAMLCIEGPGEYEVADFSIKGVAAVRHIDPADAEKLSTLYRVEIGDVRIGILGNIAAKLSEDQLEELGVLDYSCGWKWLYARCVTCRYDCAPN